MFKILLILFIVVPLLEIFLLIQIGSVIGAWPTIGLVLLTAILGAGMLRIQGFSTLIQIRESLDRRELPALQLVEGLLLVICGALLLTPGFFTDTLGFLCLIPAIRSEIAKALLHKVFSVRVTGNSNQRPENGPRTLEGEYWEEDK